MKKFVLILSFIMFFAIMLQAKPEEKVGIVDAVMNSPKLSLDGEPVNINGYMINGSNYFRIRDIAAIVSSTGRKFDVGFDKEQNMVSIELGKAYSGSKDLFTPKNPEAKGESRKTICLVDNYQYPLESVLIDGNNYVKLRDLAKLVGFSVDYDKSKGEVLIKTIFKDYVETEEYNEYDNLKDLAFISVDSVKKLSESEIGGHKLEVESKGDGIKFYVNHDGKRERFYLKPYYGETYFTITSLYGQPKDKKELSFYENTRNTIKFIDELNEKLDKAGRDNLNLKLPVYNYIFFVSKTNYPEDLSVDFNILSHSLYGISEDETEFPLAFNSYNLIGAAATTISEDSVRKDDSSGRFVRDCKIIPLGNIFPYIVKGNGETKKIISQFAYKFDKDTRLLVIDYVISGVKGKMLVYYVD